MRLPGFDKNNNIILGKRCFTYRAKFKVFIIYANKFKVFQSYSIFKRQVTLQEVYDWRKKHPVGRIPKGLKELRAHLMEHCPEIFYV